ncbi:hypothetical protein [Derxia lacustris]|uniref:hypothetical protein n=1 Tax=Derxia lacustris TaxID=764842 RepID=UPI000A17325C|nr:hypothetical protein [Derxia lacustris]
MQTNQLRSRGSLVALALVAGAFQAAPAHAVESSRPVIGIWDTRQPNAQGVLGGARVTPADQVNTELQAPANGCSLGTVDGDGYVTATRKRRITIRNGDMTVEGTYDIAVASLPFPAYGTAAASGVTYFREDNQSVTQSASCTSFPYDRRQGGGIATLANGSKVRVFGFGPVGYYRKSGVSYNVGRFSVFVFDVGGSKRSGFPKTWPVVSDTGLTIDPTLSGVGDFIGGDGGTDELRVAFYKDYAASTAHPNGYRTWSYYFYSLTDGTLIVKRDITVNNP